MKTYKKWTESSVNYNAGIDGPPLNPKSIYGAEIQIRQLATNIRTTFGLDARYNKQAIQRACELLDQASNLLDDGSMTGDQRHMPHQYVSNHEIR